MDCIHIKDILLDCIIGVCQDERRKRQTVKLNVTLHCDLQPAVKSDKLEDTVDYAAIMERVRDEVKKSRYFLLEALANRIAELCLSYKHVKAVDVTVAKPQVLHGSIQVEIHRVSLHISPVKLAAGARRQ